MTATIATDRLDLVPMTPAFLRSTVSGDRAGTESMLGLKIPSAWFDAADFAAMRLRQLEEGATAPDWLPRAIGLRTTGEMIGYLGFHTSPHPDYLKNICPEGVEFGYTIFSDHRRRNYAWEAILALINDAHLSHGVRFFVVSVSPENVASLSLISKLGFRRIGSHIDEIDGPEDIFELLVDHPLPVRPLP
jgi:[ribosomal protein S5]-alanine N-acetyltransferase